MDDFVHLHNHSYFSPLDGKTSPKELAKAAKDMGCSAVALTDHGSMNGIIHFQKACKDEKVGIKPILGVEAYETDDRTIHNRKQRKDLAYDDHHLVLLARDEEGYKNMCYIVSDAATTGFFDRTEQTDMTILQDHGKGLIALSACLGGRIPKLLLAGLDAAAETWANTFKNTFDYFFLELQPNNLPDQLVLNQKLLELAKKTGIPLIGTCDSHYLKPSDAEPHDTMIAMRQGKVKDDPQRFRFDGKEYYLRTIDQMKDWIRREKLPEEVLSNTVYVASLCDYTIPMDQRLLPDFDVPLGYTPESYLTELAHTRLDAYLNSHPEFDRREYNERLDYELDVINSKGYASYFHIVGDLFDFCAAQGIPTGPGRGSSAGSLVAFVQGITQLDPIVHGLFFERFLNPERASLPDVDSDIDYFRRGEVIQYIQKKYHHVAQIGTYGTIGAKSGVRDLARVYGVPNKVADDAAKTLPDSIGPRPTTIKEFLEVTATPEKFYEELGENNAKSIAKKGQEFLNLLDPYPQMIDEMQALNGVVKNKGVHAAGVIIAPAPLHQFAPLTSTTGSAQIEVCGYDMKSVDSLGLLKLDLLGLKTVTVVNDAARMAGIDIKEIPLDDPFVWASYQQGNTHGTFQTAADGFTRFIMSCQPKEFADLVAIVACYRPGPLNGLLANGKTMAEQFIANMNDPSQITYDHPDLEPILSPTKGVLLYQEQVMLLGQKFAGYSLGGADVLRKAVGKKDLDLMLKLESEFVGGCVENGYEERLGKYLYDMIKFFAGYGFNKSHSACYALISYQTMWLKLHYPAEFMCALMASDAGDLDKTAKHVKECRRLRIQVLPPDVNKSEARMKLEVLDNREKAIRMGLMSIKGVGEAHCTEIMALGPYPDLEDFNGRVPGRRVNKNVVSKLILAGAFDYLNENRYANLNHYNFDIKKFKEADPNDPGKKDVTERMDSTEFTEEKLLELEKELFGAYISHHPLDYLPYKRWEYIKNKEKVEMGGIIKKLARKEDKNGNEMASFLLETIEDERWVTVFSSVYAKVKDKLGDRRIVIVRGKKDGNQILANEIVSGTKAALKKRSPQDADLQMPVKESLPPVRVDTLPESDPLNEFLSNYS